jgi:hypothetical protein
MSQILLSTIDKVSSSCDDKIINNQYYKLHTYVNNSIIDYIISVINRKFEATKNIREHTKEFRFAIYTNHWYRSNLNMYTLFCLYLMNTGIIRARHTEVINTIVTNMPTVDYHSMPDDRILTFIFEFLHLFRVNKWLAQLFILFIQYISQHDIQIRIPYQKEAYEYIYNKIQEDYSIPEYIKDDVTEAMAMAVALSA